MLTSAECRERAEQKLAEVKLQPRHQKNFSPPPKNGLSLLT